MTHPDLDSMEAIARSAQAVHERPATNRFSTKAEDDALDAFDEISMPKDVLALIARIRELEGALRYAVSWIESLPQKNASHMMRDDKLEELLTALHTGVGGASL